MVPWDQRLARIIVRPLVGTPLTPNHLTIITLLLALSAGALFATGHSTSMNWAAGLFVLARFIDHFDGELARQSAQTSKFGYYFDYVVGAIAYCALFLGIGFGVSDGPLGGWALVLGISGALSALVALPLNLSIDTASESESAVGYPALAGFELEDGIYLIAPITWFGYLHYFFVLAGIGAVMYLLWTAWCLYRTRSIGLSAAIGSSDDASASSSDGRG